MTNAYSTSCYKCDIYTQDNSAHWIYDCLGRNTIDTIDFKQIRVFQCFKCSMIIILEITKND